MRGRRWLHPVSNPEVKLTAADLCRNEEMNYVCGHSEDDIVGLHSTVENFRVRANILPEWNFERKNTLSRLPCSMLYWLDSTCLTPNKFLKYVWGKRASLEAYNPRAMIGELDKGCLEEYVYRCVVESGVERYCKACSSTQSRLKLGALELLGNLADSDFLMIMSDVVEQKYEGNLGLTPSTFAPGGRCYDNGRTSV